MGPKQKKNSGIFQISVSNEFFERKKNPFFKVITCGPARMAAAALEASKFSVNKANGCSKAHFLVNAQPAAKAFSFAVQASYYIILQMGDFQAKRNSKSELKITCFLFLFLFFLTKIKNKNPKTIESKSPNGQKLIKYQRAQQKKFVESIDEGSRK